MKFDIFDSFLDAVFVINKDRDIVYCNEAASVLTEMSMKRIVKTKKIYDILTFENKNLFVMPHGNLGRDKVQPFTELKFGVRGKEREGKVQLSISPIEEEDNVWLVVLHDVTLEEQLHVKYLIELNIKEKVIEDLKSAQKALEAYSKNLEQMVADRTKNLSEANLLLNAIMNSLGQGFLVFDENAQCGSVYTKACLDILEANPENKSLSEVLNLNGNEKSQFEQWVKTAFSEVLEFESLIELGPRNYMHTAGRNVTLDFYPIRDEKKKIQKIVLVATDNTKEHEAEVMAQKEKTYSNMIIRLVKNKSQFGSFIKSAQQRIEKLLFYSKNKQKFDSKEIFRILHTLEGEAGVFGAVEITAAAKKCQNTIEILKNDFDKYFNETFVKFKKEIGDLSSCFQDFLITNDDLFIRLGVYGGRKVEISESRLKKFMELMKASHVDKQLVNKFKYDFLKESIEKYLLHYDEIIKGVAQRQGKKVMPLKLKNGNLKITPDYYKPLFSSLVHAFRNAVDHGIETPEERKQCGKIEVGKIEVLPEFFERNGEKHLRITIKDDGRGIDTEKIRKKIFEKTKDKSKVNLNDFEIQQNIFSSGLSSREEITEFSGRGVGMDAIKAEVDKMDGKIWVESKFGLGTQVTIEVPDVKTTGFE